MRLPTLVLAIGLLTFSYARAGNFNLAAKGQDGMNIIAAASELGDFVMSIDILKTTNSSATVLYGRLGFPGPVTKNSFYLIGNEEKGIALLAGSGGLTGESRSTASGEYIQLNAFSAILNDSIIPADESAEGLNVDFSSGLQGLHDRLLPHRPRILNGFFNGGALTPLRPEAAAELYRRILDGDIRVTVPHRLRRSYVVVRHPLTQMAFHLSAPLYPDPSHSMNAHPAGPRAGLAAFKAGLKLRIVSGSTISEVRDLPMRMVLTPEMVGPVRLATQYAPSMAVIELPRAHYLVLPNMTSPFLGLAQDPLLLRNYLKQEFGVTIKDFSVPLMIDANRKSVWEMTLIEQSPEFLAELFEENGVYLQSGVNYTTVMGYYLAAKRAEGTIPNPAALECEQFLQKLTSIRD